MFPVRFVFSFLRGLFDIFFVRVTVCSIFVFLDGGMTMDMWPIVSCSGKKGLRSKICDRVFGGFFVDVEGCLLLMREIWSVAWGRAVFHALVQPSDWEPFRLCLKVSSEVSGVDVALMRWRWFVKMQGYEEVERSSEVLGERRFLRELDGKEVFIEIMGSEREVVGSLLATFRGTHLANFATHEAVYSCFPQLTVDSGISCMRDVRLNGNGHGSMVHRMIKEEEEGSVGLRRLCDVDGGVVKMGVGEMSPLRGLVEKYTKRVPFSVKGGQEPVRQCLVGSGFTVDMCCLVKMNVVEVGV